MILKESILYNYVILLKKGVSEEEGRAIVSVLLFKGPLGSCSSQRGEEISVKSSGLKSRAAPATGRAW